MIKNILGGLVGSQLAKSTTKIDNGTGAILGSIAPTLIARMSLPALIAIGVGGYLFKRHRDQQAADGRDTPTGTASTPVTAA